MPSLQQKTYLANLFHGYPGSVRVSHNLADGLFYAPIQQVLDGLFPYCSVNPANSYNSIVLDYDKNWLDLDWDKLPVPNVAVINPKNSHAHFFYLLKAGVHKNPGSSGKALRFLSDTVEKMTYWTGSDFAFTGNLGKNAMSEVWAVAIQRLEPYELAELSDWFESIPKETVRQCIAKARVESRNCAIFDTVRAWAYKNYHKYMNGEFQAYFSAVQEQADRHNQMLDSPLIDREVYGIAKSISKWTWNNIYKGEQFMAYSARNRQQAIKVRQAKSQATQKAVWAMYFNCRAIDQPTQQEIADKLGISRMQVSRYIREYKSLNLAKDESPDQMQFAF